MILFIYIINFISNRIQSTGSSDDKNLPLHGDNTNGALPFNAAFLSAIAFILASILNLLSTICEIAEIRLKFSEGEAHKV